MSPSDFHQAILAFFSTIFLSIYYITLFKFPRTISLYFWIHLITYGILIYFYMYDPTFLGDPPHAESLRTIIFDTSLVNMPLYLLSSICLAASFVLIRIFITNYSIITAIALGQLSLIVSSITHFMLRDPDPISYTIGAAIIALGGLIISLPKFSIKHPIKNFASYDKKLLQLALYYSGLMMIMSLISDLCTTSYNPLTKTILHNMTKFTHVIPFITMSPIFFNIGLQFTNMIVFYIYSKNFSAPGESLFGYLLKHRYIIAFLSFCSATNMLLYYISYANITDKIIFAAVDQLYIPLTFILAYIFLRIKVTLQHIVGMGLIGLGTAVMLIFR